MRSMHILVVDDEKLIRDVIKEYLINEGYTVLEASNGIDAIEMVKIHKNIDLIVMDIMMPKMDGFSAVKEIKNFSSVPIIMLSARGEEYDKLSGFDLGIDDYVTKPFSPKELVARVKAVLKRNGNEDVEEYKYKDLIINYKSHTVKIENKELELTPKEYDLLTYFTRNENVALSREQLLSKIWGYDFFGDDRTIDTHIKTLRNSLGKYRKFIVTVRAIGYKFEYHN